MQVCLVGRKGSDPPGMRGSVGHDVIYSERRGQSQKPEEIYQLIEHLVPHGELQQPTVKSSPHVPYISCWTQASLGQRIALSCREVSRDLWAQEQLAKLLGDAGERGHGHRAAARGCGVQKRTEAGCARRKVTNCTLLYMIQVFTLFQASCSMQTSLLG